MKAELIKLLQKGQTFSDLKSALDGKSIGGGKVRITVDNRALPYLAHVVAGWVDGPPGSNVAAVLSGADPAGGKWRRFSLSCKGPYRYEIDVFPTPFTDAAQPLSPGIPPAGRTAAH
jgi:hypothetical protein